MLGSIYQLLFCFLKVITKMLQNIVDTEKFYSYHSSFYWFPSVSNIEFADDILVLMKDFRQCVTIVNFWWLNVPLLFLQL